MQPILRVSISVMWAALCLSVTHAEVPVVCQPNEFMHYYVLWGRALDPYDVLHTYTATDRVVEELQPAAPDQKIVHGVCESDVQHFEAGMQIQVGQQLGEKGSELFEVLDLPSGQVVGTLWADTLMPFDQGGAVSLVRYRHCPGAAGSSGLVNNIGAWSTGLDTGAMNNADPALIESAWTQHVRQMVAVIADFQMIGTVGCTLTYDLQLFLSKYKGTNVPIHYIQIDPTGGIMGQPGP
jgi:hypothetical protein